MLMKQLQIKKASLSPIESESGQDSLERVQKKLQGRRRLESNNSGSAFSNSSTYKGFLSTQQKESLMSLAEESSIDDRPECDLHFGSLSRHAGNGYNSDTESAPSRTLGRPGKILEVSSPTKTTVPSRYYMKPQSETGKRTLSAQPSYTHQLKQQSRITLQRQQYNYPASQKSTVTSELSASLELNEDLYPDNPVVPVVAEPLVTTTRTISTSKANGGGAKRRTKSGDRVEKLTEVYKSREQEKVNANIEDAKVKLGLIPPQRQRSRSTSEKEAMKILHKVTEEDERTAASQSSPREEWTLKHKEWLSSAPTSAERKKAWENLSKSQFQRMEYKSRSLRGGEGLNDKSVMMTMKGSFTPEMKRKCATLPDNIICGKLTKTVKVRTYEIPVQRIRRINLRTYH